MRSTTTTYAHSSLFWLECFVGRGHRKGNDPVAAVEWIFCNSNSNKHKTKQQDSSFSSVLMNDDHDHDHNDWAHIVLAQCLSHVVGQSCGDRDDHSNNNNSSTTTLLPQRNRRGSCPSLQGAETSRINPSSKLLSPPPPPPRSRPCWCSRSNSNTHNNNNKAQQTTTTPSLESIVHTSCLCKHQFAKRLNECNNNNNNKRRELPRPLLLLPTPRTTTTTKNNVVDPATTDHGFLDDEQ